MPASSTFLTPQHFTSASVPGTLFAELGAQAVKLETDRHITER